MANNMRYFIGNWKMFGVPKSINILNKINTFTKFNKRFNKNYKIIITPPFTLIESFAKRFKKKSILIGIIAASFIFSLIYAFNKEETYKAQAYLIPPESRYTQPLNVFLDDGYRLSREEITPSTIYRVFMLNLQSRKYHFHV